MFENERNRILDTYSQRSAKGVSRLYGWTRPDVIVSNFSRQLVTAKLLASADKADLKNSTILDVGCGSGEWLTQFLQWGANPANLYGIDLLEERVAKAQNCLPKSHIAITEGWPLPFDDRTFDIVCANTVVSSIHDQDARTKLAAEMLRINRTQGAILIFDFFVNKPGSSDTIAVKKKDISVLFPDCTIVSRSMILAPPLNRFIAPKSTTLAVLLERVFPFLRTHAMHLIQRKASS